MTDPLVEDRLRAQLVDPGWYRSVAVVASTGSTNADLRSAALDGLADGAVLVAEEQTQGRGRLDRGWQTPAGAGLAVSVLRRPATVRAERWGWLPLLVGLAVTEAVREVSEVPADLKWPNDVLVADRKLAGVLVERVETADGTAVVVGIGLNVSLSAAQLPAEGATSLALEGARGMDREALLVAILVGLARRYDRWQSGMPLPLQEYRARSATLGRSVRVHLPGGRVVAGLAADVDDQGCLVVASGDERHRLAAGDVVHVR
jgi:BirA family transcriptional regulator, biotin operon repressor / biotin---[acetyl-CoA-carboxylase] ligase